MPARRLLVALAVLLLAPGLLADTITTSNGREISGRIVKESFSEIEYRRSGVSSTQTIGTDEVVSIVYGSTPKQWREGMQQLELGNSVAAAELFYIVASDPDVDAPDHVRASALAMTGQALIDDTDFSSAVGIFDELLKKHPNTRHLAAALLGKGRSLVFLRRFGEADGVLEQLKTDATEKNLGEVWGLEAEFLLLLSAEAQKKAGVADGYRQLRARTKTSHPGISNQAALRMGRVELAAGNVREAEPLFQEIIDQRLETDKTVVAGAYNGRAQCSFGRAQGLLGQGDQDRALEYYHDALLDFLRVHVHYPGVNIEQAEALYGAGQSFLNIASLDPEATEAEMRGRVLLKRCADRFSSSEWGRKAAQSN